MIRLALALAFLGTFGLAAWAVAVRILRADNEAEKNRFKPKTKTKSK